jgi:DnaJ family protein C protein 3
LRGVLVGLAAISVVGAESSSTFVSQGDRHLGVGEVQAAINAYDSAIKAEPDNYLYLFKRGAAYLSAGKDSKALEDLNEVLRLQPEFEGALNQRARILIQRGRFDEAKKDGKRLGEEKRKEMERTIAETEKMWKEGEKRYRNKDYQGCDELVSVAVDHSPKNAQLRRLRAECKLHNANLRGALVDLSHLQNLEPQQTANYVKSARVHYYGFHEYDKALQNLRRCLQFDPDSKECIGMNKQIRRAEKGIKDFTNEEGRRKKASGHPLWDAILQALETDGLYQEMEKRATAELAEIGVSNVASEIVQKLDEALCDAHLFRKSYDAGLPHCETVLKHRPDYVQAILLKAQRALDAEKHDEAIHILREAIDQHGVQDSKVQSKLREAHIEAKRAKSKDYYKILGISKSADDREIKKAFRSKTKEYHPDKYRGDLSQEQVLQKMADINEAYEILSDSEKRHQYDSGQLGGDQDGPFGGSYEQRFHGNPFGPGGAGFDFGQFGKQFHFQFQR